MQNALQAIFVNSGQLCTVGLDITARINTILYAFGSISIEVFPGITGQNTIQSAAADGTHAA